MTLQDKYEALAERYCDIMEALSDAIGSPEEKGQLQREAEAIEWELKDLERKMEKEEV